ncbi:MAG: multidrug effflux MFS transporter [Rikenellaceae bacterium]|nr:multidrug effflux MFS transporter [Rikenellaceae bacterium]
MDKLVSANSRTFLIVTLGGLAAFGPLVTDMYLPGLPAMTDFFSTSVSLVQSGITASMLGLAAGQLLIGPVSDRVGRRRPLLWSMWLFMVSTVLCIFARSIESFIFFRFVQGVAGSGGIVLSRSISADLFTGKDLARFFAVIAGVQGLAPVAAPVLGGAVLSFTDWKGVFWALLFIGALLTVLCYFYRETLPVEKRSKGNLMQTFRLFGPVLRNSKFMLCVSLLSFSMAILFAYIAASPFIFQEYYGLSPLVYSLYFAANTLAVMAGTICSGRFSTPAKAVKAGVYLMVPLAAATSAILMAGLGFGYICLPLFALLFATGLTFPSSATIAIESERKNAGTAAAVLGAMNFIFGGIVTPLVGLGNMLVSTGIVLTGCAVLAFLLTLVLFRGKASHGKDPR